MVGNVGKSGRYCEVVGMVEVFVLAGRECRERIVEVAKEKGRGRASKGNEVVSAWPVVREVLVTIDRCVGDVVECLVRDYLGKGWDGIGGEEVFKTIVKCEGADWEYVREVCGRSR